MTTDLPPTPAAPGFVRAHPVLAAVLALVAVIAIALPTVVVLTAPTPTRIAKKIQKHQRVVPPAELPPVEPVSYINLAPRSEEHKSALQSLMRISYDVFCLKK